MNVIKFVLCICQYLVLECERDEANIQTQTQEIKRSIEHASKKIIVLFLNLSSLEHCRLLQNFFVFGEHLDSLCDIFGMFQ